MADNPDGLKEFEIRALDQAEQSPSKKFRRRHRRELAHVEILEIIRLSQKEFWPRENVAKKHRISVQLVSSIIRDSQKRPDKIQEVKKREEKEV